MYKARKIVNKASQIFVAVAILAIAVGAAPTLLPVAQAANPPASGTVTPDKSSELRISATFSHVVAAGDNRLLGVAVMIRANEWVSSITYSVNSLTLAKVQDGGESDDQRVELWYLLGPPVGTANVVVNFASYVNPSGYAAVNFTGVDQASPIGATAGASATSGTNATTQITTLSADSLIFGAVSARGNNTNPFTTTSPMAELWDDNTGIHISDDDGLWGGKQEALTTGTYTFNTTLSNDSHWAIACLELKSWSPPSFESIAADKLAYKNGDTITLIVTLDNHNTGCTLTADFSQIDSQYFSGEEDVVNWGTDTEDNNDDGHIDEPAEQGVYVIIYLISTENSKADASYSVPVTAVDGAGNLATDSTPLTLDNTPPSAPTNLSATALSEGGIKLTWTASSSGDVDKYNIYKATTSGGQNYSSPTYQVSAGTTTYTDTATTNGTTYYYVVRAQDVAGNIETNTSEASATAGITTGPSFSSITADKSSYKDGDTITLTVTLANHNTGCTLTADFSNIDDQYVTGGETVENWGTDGVDNNDDGHIDEPAEQGVYIISYLISLVNTKADGPHSVPVTATDAAANSTSSSISLSLDNTAPPAPTNLSATAIAGGSIKLTWTASSPETGVAQYNIYRATTSGGQDYSSPTYTVSVGTTTYTDTSTTDGQTYYYVVRAQDAAGNIETNTNEVSAIAFGTGPPAPTSLTATAIAGGSIKLTWTASSPETDVSQYNIYRATSSGGQNYSSPTYTVSVGTTTYNDTSTTDGVTYYYVVRAQDAAGNVETNTNEVSATASVAGPSATVSQIYIEYGGEVLYDLASSTDSDNPTVFAKGKIDEIYLRLDLHSGFELNEASSSITLFKGVGEGADEVSGSQEINQGTGWAELIFHLDPVFNPDVDHHSRDDLYWVDASAVGTGGSTNDFDFYFIYDTTSPEVPDFGVSSFNSSTGRVSISGSTRADASDPQEVEIFLNGESQGTVTADGTGYFSKDNISLVMGDNFITVQSTDKAGNKSSLSGSLHLKYNPQSLLSIVIRSSHVVRSGSATIPVKIIYSVTQPAQVAIHIYNLHGEIVKEWSEWVSPGEEPEWSWFGDNMYGEIVNNGVYILKVSADNGGGRSENVTKLLGVLR